MGGVEKYAIPAKTPYMMQVGSHSGYLLAKPHIIPWNFVKF